VRRALGGSKVGHAGTLDPEATGVLVICLGRATKISAFLMEGEKTYVGTGKLGVATDTQDASGRVTSERIVAVTADEIRVAARRFVGHILQVPPMFSAVKVEGQKLYRLARRGVEVERAARPVTVHSFEITDVALPLFEFSLRCSKGTYVRTVVHDLGEALGCGAHLASLRREAQGGFGGGDALAWSALDGPGAADAVRAACIPPEEALAFLPALEVRDTAPLVAGALLAGTATAGTAPPAEPGVLVRLLVPGGRVSGVARLTSEGARVLHVFPPARAGRAPRRP
jgi:tRNA pseudouridine55 synthase